MKQRCICLHFSKKGIYYMKSGELSELNSINGEIPNNGKHESERKLTFKNQLTQ